MQIWSDDHLGKRSNAGIENESMRTAFCGCADNETIPFGLGVVQKAAPGNKADNENLVVVAGTPSNIVTGVAQQFQGFAAFSQEATVFTDTHTGPGVNYSVYTKAYKPGDVVGLIDRGSVIVKIAESSKGIQAGDKLCVLDGGQIESLKNITPVEGGTDTAIIIDAIAESNGLAGQNIGIQLYSIIAYEIKYTKVAIKAEGNNPSNIKVETAAAKTAEQTIETPKEVVKKETAAPAVEK